MSSSREAPTLSTNKRFIPSAASLRAFGPLFLAAFVLAAVFGAKQVPAVLQVENGDVATLLGATVFALLVIGVMLT